MTLHPTSSGLTGDAVLIGDGAETPSLGSPFPEIHPCDCHPASLCASCHRCDAHDVCKCLDSMYPEDAMPEEPEEEDDREPVPA